MGSIIQYVLQSEIWGIAYSRVIQSEIWGLAYLYGFIVMVKGHQVWLKKIQLSLVDPGYLCKILSDINHGYKKGVLTLLYRFIGMVKLEKEKGVVDFHV